MTTKNLLVELFVEELPPKALKKLGEAFASAVFDGLQVNHFLSEASAMTSYASPRRLAVRITGVRETSVPKVLREKLMPVSVGLAPDGKPTPALIKKLVATLGYPSDAAFDEIIAERVRRESDGKQEVLVHESLPTGTTLRIRLEGAIENALAKLPIPKVMSYQLADGWSTVNFVRPVHGLVVLHGADVVPMTVLGIDSGRLTHGHRFEASIDPIELKDADHYEQQLEAQGAVIASFAARRDEIARQLQAAAVKQGLAPIDDAALLDEVTALVERPNVLVCRFEPEFLAVPPECLILTMKANQKYFPLLDAAGSLTNQFLVVSNIRPADASRVVEGNERVVRPRLADAKFFFDQDRKKTLESRVAGLDKVVYHGKLGTQGERAERVRAIARAIGQQLGGDALAAQADRAAMLAKADLLTDMVGEFPALQGTMGGYYARHDGETDDVATAIEDHYKPRFAGDTLPRNMVGVVVALADKLETLVGMFRIGQVPTGDKDPFALRRNAIGAIRMLVEQKLDVSLDELIRYAERPFKGLDWEGYAALTEFIYDRLAGGLREQGYSPQEVDAVLALRPAKLVDVTDRLTAVRAFAAMPEASSLAAANKRVGNILKKAEESTTARVDTALLREPAEIALLTALLAVKQTSDGQFESGNYTASLQALAALRAPVDAFFDTVMVNAEDAALRKNRLGLLATLHAAMNRVADLSKLAT